MGFGNINMDEVRRFYEEKNISYGTWKTSEFMWISTTQPITSQLTDDYIPNTWDGWLTELQKLGNSGTYTPGSTATEIPYPSRLRPLDNISLLAKAKNIRLLGLELFALDTTNPANTNQSATVNDLIKTSQSTPIGAYLGTRNFATIPVTWYPNLCRPNLQINGENIFDSINNNAWRSQNQGDMSMGLDLPYSRNCSNYWENGIPTSAFAFEGAVGQFIVSGATTYIKRYPLVVKLLFSYVV